MSPMPLQFGHGTEPWRNSDPSDPSDPFAPLQFGHGTEPWRNLVYRRFTDLHLLTLQFGHGTEPWRNDWPSGVSSPVEMNFNSATARSRGETG